MERNDLISHLENEIKVLNTEPLKRAFTEVDRADFLHVDYAPEAYEDYALPIGAGQKTSKPSFVAFMLELLDLKEGDRVLNVGSGSGYSTALIANIIGKKGHVWGVEIQPELAAQSRANLSKYPSENITILDAVDVIGNPQKEPYDRILVNGSVEQVPQELFDQLKEGGVIVIPIKDAVSKIVKVSGEEAEESTYPGFFFDPLEL